MPSSQPASLAQGSINKTATEMCYVNEVSVISSIMDLPQRFCKYRDLFSATICIIVFKSVKALIGKAGIFWGVCRVLGLSLHA